MARISASVRASTSASTAARAASPRHPAADRQRQLPRRPRPKAAAHYKGVNLGFKKRWDGKISVRRVVLAVEGHVLHQPARHRRVRRVPDPERVRPVPGPPGRARCGATARHRVTISPSGRPASASPSRADLPLHSRVPRSTSSPAPTTTATASPPTTCRRASKRYNAGRGADFSQLDLRVSKQFRSRRSRRLPADRRRLQPDQRQEPGRDSFVQAQTASNFGQPTLFAGDFQHGEQRLAQLGIRFEF